MLGKSDVEELRARFSWTNYCIEMSARTAFTVGIAPALDMARGVLRFPLTRKVNALFEGFEIHRAPGASWFWWTYATFSFKKKRVRFKLSPRQAVRMLIRSDNWPGDSGVLRYSMRRLVSWQNARTAGADKAVFLSYPQSRQAEAEYVANVLKGFRLDPWYDKDRLAPGDDLPDEIAKGITVSSCFVPLLCPEYIASSWCRRELELAVNSGDDLLIRPIRIEPRKFFIPDDVEKLLNSRGEILHANISGEDGLEQLQAAAAAIHTQLAERE